MNWISNVVRPKIRGLWTKREIAGESLGQMPGDGRDGLPQGSGGQPVRLPRLRLSPARRRAHPLPPVLRRRRMGDDPYAAGRRRSAALPRRAPLYGAAEGGARPRPAWTTPCCSAPAASKACRVVAAVQDFDFMGGSLGMAAAEAIIAGARSRLRAPRCPTCSSPARAARACRRASCRSCSCRAPPSPCRW